MNECGARDSPQMSEKIIPGRVVRCYTYRWVSWPFFYRQLVLAQAIITYQSLMLVANAQGSFSLTALQSWTSAIFTITDRAVSGLLFNLVRWVLSYTSITTNHIHPEGSAPPPFPFRVCASLGVYVHLADAEEKMHCPINYIINSINSQHAN